MTTTTKTRHGGLDWNVPRDGRASDAYEVAATAAVLMRIALKRAFPTADFQAARHATRLHVISGLLHKLAERACNEDLTCRACEGYGRTPEERTCSACAGTGQTIGRKLESLRADAQEIAEHYGLTCYFLGDPRGCSLYIGTAEQLEYDYTRGHAVTRLGR